MGLGRVITHKVPVLIGALVLVSASCIVASATTAVAATTYSWKMMVAVAPAPGEPFSVGALETAFCNAVTKATNGQLTITLYSPNELPYTPQETLTAVGSGAVQIGDGGAFVATTSPVDALLQLPGVVTSVADFTKALPLVTSPLKTELSALGDSLLYSYSYPPTSFWGTSDLNSLSSLKTTVRTATAQQAYLVQQLGGTAVTLSSSEVAEALSTGVITGDVTSGVAVLSGGYASLLQSDYELYSNVTPGFVVVNTAAYQSLPANLQTTLSSIAASYQKQMLATAADEEVTADRLLKDEGITFNKATPADYAKVASIMNPYNANYASTNDLTPLYHSLLDIALKPKSTKVTGEATPGAKSVVKVSGSDFYGTPKVTSSAVGTKVSFVNGSSSLMNLKVTSPATATPGVRVMTVTFKEGQVLRIKYTVK